MNIQDKVAEIHMKYGMSELANYKIQLLFEEYLNNNFECQFKKGDKVRKPKGYSFDGIVVSVFKNTNNEIRIVAELEGNGMLHIFSPSQLEARSE